MYIPATLLLEYTIHGTHSDILSSTISGLYRAALSPYFSLFHTSAHCLLDRDDPICLGLDYVRLRR